MRGSKRTLRRLVRVTLVLLVLYTIAGFVVLPPIVKAQLATRLSAALGRSVTVGSVRLNPYALSLTISQFDIRERDGAASFLGWDRLYVRFGLLASLTGWQWTFPAIRLDGPHVRAVVNPDGSLNCSDILTRLGVDAPAPPAPATPPPRPLRIGALAVTGATIDFTDQARPTPFHTTVGPLVFSLAGFRTVGDRQAPYRFAATTESGEKLAWQGWILASPFRSGGEVSLQNIILKKYAPYYAGWLQGDLADGRLDLRTRYELSLDASHRLLQATDGALQVHDLRVMESGSDRPAVELSLLDVNGFSLDAVARKAAVGAVTLTGGHLTVRRERDGAINLLGLLPPAPAPAAGPAAAGPAALPDLTISEITLKDFSADIADLTPPRPAQLRVSALQFSLRDFTLAPAAAMPLTLSLLWAPQGTVLVNGTVTLRPAPLADLKIEVADLAIPPLSPYLEQLVNARIVHGSLATSARLQLAPGESVPAVTLTGDAHLEKFALVDGARQEELAGFSYLALGGLEASTAPRLTLTLGDLTVDGPYARIVRQADQSINLAGLARPAAAAPPAATVTVAPPAPAPAIAIHKVTLVGGDFSFVDRSLEPNVRLALTQMGGTITGLSSDNPARGDVDLQGVVGGVGRVTVTGKLDPLGPTKSVDLATNVTGVDLLSFSPYCGKFAGYELARGKLLLEVKLRLTDQRLDSNNVVTLEQFAFGAPTNSPDATHLPVRLGVALLKDLDGRIVIDLPVAGNINDPSFRVGKVVIRVIVNLLTKAAVSPFALLGSMFGGGGEDLAWQEFTPGTTDLRPGEEAKLATLVKALTNRPGLSLDIAGDYDGAADAAALREQKFAEFVRRRVWEAHRANDPALPPPDPLAIPPEEQAAMVRTLYDERFPPGSELGAPPPAAAVEPPPGSPHHGLIRKVGDAVTFQWLRRKHPAAPPPAPKPAPPGAAPAGPSLEEMTARLVDTMTVDPNDLGALAAARAAAVRDHFIQTGKIPPERLFLAKAPAADASSAAHNRGARVFLTLR